MIICCCAFCFLELSHTSHVFKLRERQSDIPIVILLVITCWCLALVRFLCCYYNMSSAVVGLMLASLCGIASWFRALVFLSHCLQVTSSRTQRALSSVPTFTYLGHTISHILYEHTGLGFFCMRNVSCQKITRTWPTFLRRRLLAWARCLTHLFLSSVEII